jgi:hypothetical protein
MNVSSRDSGPTGTAFETAHVPCITKAAMASP